LIREFRHQRSFDSSAGLIAVFHALHRLSAPRHPPHALSSLAALIPPSPPPVARSRQSRHRFQGTTPTTWVDDGQSNDPFLSRAARRVRKQTTSRQARACRAVVACDLQLLPLPNCQRTSAARRVCQKQISGERFPKQKSVLSDFLLAGSRCTLLECSDSHPLKIGPLCQPRDDRAVY
jgi:hypothetical protein